MTKQLVRKLKAQRTKAYLNRPKVLTPPKQQLMKAYSHRANGGGTHRAAQKEDILDLIEKVFKKKPMPGPIGDLLDEYLAEDEPQVQVSADRPRQGGKTGRIVCTCGKGPFWTNTQFQLHLKTLTKAQLGDHLGDFIPDDATGSDTQGIADAEKLSRRFVGNIGVYAMWQGWKRQGLTEFNCIIAKKDPEDLINIYWFFSGQEHFFAEENKIMNTVRMSMVYPDRERAFRDLERGSIYWTRKFTLPSPVPRV